MEPIAKINMIGVHLLDGLHTACYAVPSMGAYLRGLWNAGTCLYTLE